VREPTVGLNTWWQIIIPGKEGNYLGLEYQLIDNERHADARLGRNGNRRMATLYDILPAREGIKINQPGEWNKVKIIVDKDHVEHWLNGEKAVVYNRESDSFKELVRMSKYNTLDRILEDRSGDIYSCRDMGMKFRLEIS
jgi:hypothetical protein